jgi:predicted DNA-binding antitoxin AbrB/MazE fold protein
MSGDIADIDLAVEIDLPEGSIFQIIRTVSGRNQIVISLKVIQHKEEKRDEQQAEERSQEAQEEQGTHEQSP